LGQCIYGKYVWFNVTCIYNLWIHLWRLDVGSDLRLNLRLWLICLKLEIETRSSPIYKHICIEIMAHKKLFCHRWCIINVSGFCTCMLNLLVYTIGVNHMCTGMLTVTDFIRVLQHYYDSKVCHTQSIMSMPLFLPSLCVFMTLHSLFGNTNGVRFVTAHKLIF